MYLPRPSNACKMRAALNDGYTIHLRDANGVTLATIGTTKGIMVITTIPTIGVPLGHLLLADTRLARRMLWRYQRLRGVRQVVVLTDDDPMTHYHLDLATKVLRRINHLSSNDIIDYDIDWRLCTAN
nr:unnamed protein product [uncultured bacterium]